MDFFILYCPSLTSHFLTVLKKEHFTVTWVFQIVSDTVIAQLLIKKPKELEKNITDPQCQKMPRSPPRKA